MSNILISEAREKMFKGLLSKKMVNMLVNLNKY